MFVRLFFGGWLIGCLFGSLVDCLFAWSFDGLFVSLVVRLMAA